MHIQIKKEGIQESVIGQLNVHSLIQKKKKKTVNNTFDL